MSAKRRDALKALFATDPATAEAENAMPAPEQKGLAPQCPVPRQSSGAVKAMGLALGGLTEEVAAARALMQELEQSGRIVDLDPGLIDAAFIADRLSNEENGDEAFIALVESIRENGQQVPVLVRPHPDKQGRYQTAYGHRRIRVAARLGKPARAIIRDLTDAELILAQGKENSERRDLSFIERAMFAKALVDRGFKRKIVEEALSLHKAEMARLIQVAEAMPKYIARDIGPAPKVGRARWMALAERLAASGAAIEIAIDETATKRFKTADSNLRFKLVYDRLARRGLAAPAKPQELKRRNGEAVARVATTGPKPRIDFIGSDGAAFAAFVATELPALLDRFEEGCDR